MKHEVSLPAGFEGLAGKVSHVQKWSAVEWSSTCPQCGGAVHKGGEWPDRFRMFTNANGKNKVFGWCRNCSYCFFPDNNTPLSGAELEAWRKTQIEAEERRKREAEEALRLLRSQKMWDTFYLAKNEWAKEVIRSWGITDEWADYWKLGLIRELEVFTKEGEETVKYFSPAISIPVWDHTANISNIQARLLNPRSAKDRYRPFYRGVGIGNFFAFRGEKYSRVLVTEGFKKAMVCAQYLQGKMQVVGVPNKTPSQFSLAALDEFEVVNVCLDPDARKDGSLSRLLDDIGRERARVVLLPGKVDDMIVDNNLDILDALKYAKPVGGKK